MRRLSLILALITATFPITGAAQGLAITGTSDVNSDPEGVVYINPEKETKEDGSIEMDDSLIYSIGQVNPMAAIMLRAFTPKHRIPVANILGGKAGSRAIPTMGTVILEMQGNPALDQIDQTMVPLSSSQSFAQTRWQASAKAKDLVEVVFHAEELDAAGLVQRQLYPAVVILVSTGAKASRVRSWHVTGQ